MTNKLNGKIAVITGGNSGLGLATAKQFVEEGAYVYITGRRQEELDKAVKSIGKNITAIQGDVTSQADLDRIYAQIKKEKGKIDILFANAGVAEFALLETVTEEHYAKIFDINVKGVMFSTLKALPLMPNNSSIILNASIVASKGMESFSVYSASKAAVRSFARTWSVDLKAKKIRVNAISPGVIPTPAFGKLGLNEQQIAEFVEHATGEIPLGRAGTPEEIAKAVVFLASSDSSYVTGIELFVDGGMAQI
jgi:NAD(P)-dependent dehydrogenase (short-subunit alcohol dehydrogenase family)